MLRLRTFFILLFSFFICWVLSCNGALEDTPVPWNAAWPLREIYYGEEKYFLIGNIISPGDLNNVRFDILKWNFNTVTAENQMKPDHIAPSSKPATGTWAYQWNNADNIVATARAAGMNVVGHTLIWHSQTPSWLTTGDRTEVLANLKKYVTEVADHFEGKLISWDVVNEAMRDNLSASDALNWKNCLRQTDSGWYKAIGSEYIEEAFLAARAADPGAKLYYNDYNLNNAAKRDAVYNMVNDINKRNTNEGGRKLIDGIGMQSHHHLGTDPQTVKDAIEKFALLNVEIAISELDIQAAGNLPVVGTVTWGDDAARRQAAQYAAMFRIFIDNAEHISRVTFWGIDDRTSWRSSSHPTLLDAEYYLKPAFYAVMSPYNY